MEGFGLSSFSFKHSSMDFLINSSSLRWGSISLHLGLIWGVLTSWVLRKTRMGNAMEPSNRAISSYCKGTRLCFMALALYNCGLCCFVCLRNGFSDGNLVIILDYFVRSLACLAMYVYTHKSGYTTRFPVWLRIWWGLFFAFSCYCLVIDVVDWWRAQFLISDLLYVITGLIFCYAGVQGEETLASSVEEPLLLNNNNGSNNNKGGYTSAGFLSVLTFSWITPLIATGYDKVLDLEDVPQLAVKDRAKGSFSAFKSRLDGVCGGDMEGHMTKLQLWKSLIYTAWGDILCTGFLALVYTLATYVGPYLIDDLVQFLNGRRRYEHEGYVLVSVFFAGKLVECIAQKHWMFGLQRAGIRLRSALMTLIYNKSLTLKQGHSSSGEMINLMTVDAPTVSMSCCALHDPWLAFIQVILALFILYKNVGWATIVAFFATVLVMLVNYPLANRLEKAQGELMEAKDKRMKATTEILKNMRILKLQAWEMNFLSKISQLRESEAGRLKRYLYINATSSAVFWDAPTFVSVATFVACLLMGIPLEAGKVLSAIATFRILAEPIYALPGTICMFLQTKVSLDRIASFLQLEDLEPDTVKRIPRADSEVAVEITGAAFHWDRCGDPTLQDINVRISHGMSVAVCGTVGSGKSSLLSCILGEMPKLSGDISVSGSVAYVAQSAWIQSGTVVDNILFGREMDRERYESVLEACSLKKDLEAFSFGDQTIIGERGINLSGGQKQRIQIARALYQDADIYLLDDPFSAVDAHTGTHLFKECLLGHLESKTVIFVTHQVEFLPAADIILVMKDGRISQAGKYSDILTSGSDFMELVGAHEKALALLDHSQTSTPSTSTVLEKNGDATASLDGENDTPKSSQPGDTDNKQKAQLVEKEEREKGKVSFQVYWKYITTVYGGALVPFILLAHISFQTLQVGSNYWMAWATPVSAGDKPAVDATTLIAVFVAFGIGGSICILLRESLLSTVAYKTATIFFDKMLHCIFCAPMAFFDATPSGRILSRASADQNNVDTVIPQGMGGVAFSTIQLLATVAIMSQVAWQIFVVFIPIACICVYYQQYYSPASRELFRLVGLSRAPVIQHFSESISGTTTIRGFNQQRRFQDRCMELIDGYSRSYFHIVATQEWLCFRLDLLSSLMFACSLAFLISIPAGVIDSGIAGLGVTYGLSLNMLQAAVIWHFSQLENKITSVERILQYTNIPSEGQLSLEANKPAPSWPSHGVVNIHDLQVRYAPHLPMVLQGITCTFPGGKKTGIVGRTGSGKSTLIQALFRIVEPASGRIVIDGVDISMIGLRDLRSRLSIIPQEPTMFEGTIRNNLDPLHEYTDEQIWQAIDRCQLDHVRDKELKLDSPVAENGENWSMGQRQLVCLARALLKKSKILVLDEATASVDTATDNLIQKTIREHFLDSTVLIIAHRITSVLDSDMVLVLSQGLVQECDSPTRLLEDGSSSFAKLVAEYTSRSNSSQR